MKLIYLDTSNFILLSELNKTNSQRFEEFATEWRSNDFVLALSQINLIELLKAKYKSTRIAHFNLLKNFLPFRYESENFFEKEINLTLFKKGFLKINSNSDLSIKFFSEIINNEEDLSLIYNSTNLISRFGLFSLISFAQKFSWKAKSKDTFHKNPKPRLSDMDKSLWGKGIKKVYTKLTGLDIKDLKNNNRAMELLLEEFRFKTQVQSLLKKYTDVINPNFAKTITENLTVKDCPGLWLRQEVEKNLVKDGSSDYKNEYDLDNIQYLPYVNCLITDRRIVEATEQVFRRNTLLNSLKSISTPKKVSNSIDSLEKILFQQ